MRFLLLLVTCVLPGLGELRLYVANNDANTITVIDPATNKVAGTINVSPNPHGLAASDDGRRLYVSSESKDVLDVVDRMTLRVIRSIPIGRNPNNIAISPDGRRVFVCIGGGTTVDVVDTASLTRTKSIEAGKTPHAIYVTPDQTRMLVTTASGIAVLNIRTEEREFEIPVPGAPRLLAIDADKHLVIQRLFVQMPALRGFEVVNYATRKITGKVTLTPAIRATPFLPGVYSYGMAIAPDHKSLWVDDSVGDAVTIFSLPDLQPAGKISVGRAPDWVVFTPNGRRCFVSNAGDNTVSSIDVINRKELARIPVGKVPKRMLVAE